MGPNAKNMRTTDGLPCFWFLCVVQKCKKCYFYMMLLNVIVEAHLILVPAHTHTHTKWLCFLAQKQIQGMIFCDAPSNHTSHIPVNRTHHSVVVFELCWHKLYIVSLNFCFWFALNCQSSFLYYALKLNVENVIASCS